MAAATAFNTTRRKLLAFSLSGLPSKHYQTLRCKSGVEGNRFKAVVPAVAAVLLANCAAAVYVAPVRHQDPPSVAHYGATIHAAGSHTK